MLKTLMIVRKHRPSCLLMAAGLLAWLHCGDALGATSASPSPESTSALTAEEWKKEAMEKFPELAIAGSPLNAAFVAKYKAYQGSNYFDSPDWPMRLAKECAGAVAATNEGTSLASRLADTSWDDPSGPDRNGNQKSFTLNADMTARASWRPKGLGSWKVLDDSRIQLQINRDASITHTLTFSKDLSEAADENNQSYHRITPPESAAAGPQGVPPTSGKAIALAQSWASPLMSSEGGGSETIADLKRLLSHSGRASNDLSTSGGDIYRGVPYLASLADAKKAFAVDGQMDSRDEEACPGFPQGLSYYSYDGNFEGHFNRLYIVTDMKNQVCMINLVDEHPSNANIPRDPNWHAYNFVNARVKAKKDMLIEHKVSSRGDHFRVDSSLYDPDLGKVLETSRWYLPQTMINLILFCVQQQNKE